MEYNAASRELRICEKNADVKKHKQSKPQKGNTEQIGKITTDGGTTENQLYKNQTERNITILYNSHIDTHNNT